MPREDVRGNEENGITNFVAATFVWERQYLCPWCKAFMPFGWRHKSAKARCPLVVLVAFLLRFSNVSRPFSERFPFVIRCCSGHRGISGCENGRKTLELHRFCFVWKISPVYLSALFERFCCVLTTVWRLVSHLYHWILVIRAILCSFIEWYLLVFLRVALVWCSCCCRKKALVWVCVLNSPVVSQVGCRRSHCRVLSRR